MKYFVEPFDDQSLQVQYRTWCKIVHPDVKGGSKDRFQEMKDEYEYIKQHRRRPPGHEQHQQQYHSAAGFDFFEALAFGFAKMYSRKYKYQYKKVRITQHFNLKKGTVDVMMNADGREITDTEVIKEFLKNNPIKL